MHSLECHTPLSFQKLESFVSLRVCLIGTDSENGRLGRLGIYV